MARTSRRHARLLARLLLARHIPARHLLARFRRAREGQVAITFVALALPILCAAGAAIDYGRRNAAKVQLDAALDGAVLAVISQKSNTVSATSLANMETQFRAEAAKVPGVTVTGFVPTPLSTGTDLTLTATYTATVRTTLGSLMGVANLGIAGTASSVRNVAQYINFYLLLDNSPSMGLAATDADVTNLQRVTGGCAFACHQHTFDARGNVTGDNMNDNYHIAKANNVKLRIEVLREAVTALVGKANDTATLPLQYQMEMWTFNDSASQTRLQALTPTLSQISTAAARVDIAYAYQNEADNQTDFERAIAKMNATIPAGGSGATAASPIRFLFFVTDGVQDTGGSISSPNPGFQYQSNRFIGPISPTTCNTLKNNNVRIGIIYTQYLPLYSNGFYNSWVKPYESKIGTSLQACASDGLYFPVLSGGDITAAMLKLFSAAVASVRITN